MKRDGLAITVERSGISSEVALRHLSRARLPIKSARDHTGGDTAPRGTGPRVRLSGQSGLHVSEGPHLSF